MAKAFLSHSSKQKKSYVEIVAKQLGLNNCIYDSFSFEEGMKNMEEIQRGMNNSDIFVLFLSDSALDSEWVQREIFDSYELLKKDSLKSIFPIIIDDKINHDDSRIPEWMKNEYNLQYVSRPTIATRRIKQRLIELSWDFHPNIKERQNLFVGRNNLIDQFEQRIDTFENPSPVAYFVCGFTHIGRRSLIKQSLRKSSIIRESYSFPSITIEIDESIEDFIRKVYDLGFSAEVDIENLLFKGVDIKIEISINLLKDLSNAKEIIQIIDNGGIISPNGELSEWFDQIIKNLEGDNKLYCVIASRYRIYRSSMREKSYIFSLNVTELDNKERIGLLKRYAEIQKVDLDDESIKIIINNLQGFPEQIFYTIDTIKENGLPYIKENPNLIIEYNSQKVSNILKKYSNDPNALDFLNLLSEFDFISLEYIFTIVGETDYYKNLIDEFNIIGIFEPIGATKEYFRLNDTIRDFVSRSRRSLPKTFEDKIKINTEEFLKDYTNREKDVSDYIFSIKNAIVKGLDVPKEFLIPSHFLKSMNDLYDKGKRHSLIIELADRVLLNSQYMDRKIEREIRYRLCISLARSGNSDRFFKEIKMIDKADSFYLLGFYFRISGNSDKAIENLDKFLNLHPNSIKGRRELVQVLIDVEDYEGALSYAKVIFENEKLNPYNIQAYIRCLLKIKPTDYKKTVESLIETLDKIDTDISKEMFYNAKANYYSVFENNETKALYTIDQCIKEFPENPYPLVTKLEICEKFRNVIEMENTLKTLKLNNPRANTYTNTNIAFEAKLLALKGNITLAINLVDSKLSHKLPSSAIDKLKQILYNY